MTSVQVGAATDVGRVRSLNEDAYFVGRALHVVVDGMGGHAAGDVASRLAIQSLARCDGPSLSIEVLLTALALANQNVVQYAYAHPESLGMGCTAAGVVDLGTGWGWFNVGDSRVYLYSEGRLRQLSHDHSEVQELVDAGRLTPEQARVHPARNVITRALGQDPPAEPDVSPVTTRPGDLFLIASDGLTTEVDDASIAAELAREATAQEHADALTQAAVAAGGRDNVTVVVVRIDGPSGEGPVSTTVPRGLIERESAS